MRLTQNIFLGYCVIFSVLLILSVAAASKTLTSLILPVFFLPIAGYFFIEIALKIKQSKLKSGSSSSDTKSFSFTSKEFLGALLLFLFLIGSSLIRILSSSPTSELISPLSSLLPNSVSPESLDQTASPSSSLQVIRIKTEDQQSLVNIRQEASATAEVIFKAKHGQIFPLVAKHNDWYEIILEKGIKGFVNSQFSVAEDDATLIKTK